MSCHVNVLASRVLCPVHRQKSFAEQQADSLRHRLDSTRVEALRVSQSRLNENSQLVVECNELRRELKTVARELDACRQREADLLRMQRGADSRTGVPSASKSSVKWPGEGSDSVSEPR